MKVNTNSVPEPSHFALLTGKGYSDLHPYHAEGGSMMHMLAGLAAPAVIMPAARSVYQAGETLTRTKNPIKALKKGAQVFGGDIDAILGSGMMTSHARKRPRPF